MITTANPDSVQSGTQLHQQTDHIIPVTAALPSPFKNLPFPQNIYAHAFLLQESKVGYLHYGLFQNDKTNLPAAQQFATDLLLARVPSLPCRVLEVGVDLGTTFSLLDARGYEVHGITPDAQQLAYIQQSLGSDVSISCHSLEGFNAQPESFGAILFRESARACFGSPFN